MKRLLKLIFFICIIIIIVVNYPKVKKMIMEQYYKKDYQEYVEKYAKEYNVDEDLIYAIIKSESNFDEEAISHKEAKGLMQIMYTTAQDVAKILEIDLTEETILEPEINIQIGTKYISMLIQKYEVTELALAAYNAGSGNVDKWIDSGTLKSDGSDIENIPYKETNMYVRKILRDYKIYKELY